MFFIDLNNQLVNLIKLSSELIISNIILHFRSLSIRLSLLDFIDPLVDLMFDLFQNVNIVDLILIVDHLHLSYHCFISHLHLIISELQVGFFLDPLHFYKQYMVFLLLLDRWEPLTILLFNIYQQHYFLSVLTYQLFIL